MGGVLHEYFPAAGFRTRDGVTVGLLTDAGFRNQWSRVIRRDGQPVKPAPNRIPDARLYSLCRPEERADGQFFVEQTFGEALVWEADNSSAEKIKLGSPSSWIRRGDVRVEEQEDVTVLAARTPEDGVIIPFAARGGEVYSLRLQYRSPRAFAVEVWDVDDHQQKLQAITLYNDRVPESRVLGRVSHLRVFPLAARERWRSFPLAAAIRAGHQRAVPGQRSESRTARVGTAPNSHTPRTVSSPRDGPAGTENAFHLCH